MADRDAVRSYLCGYVRDETAPNEPPLTAHAPLAPPYPLRYFDRNAKNLIKKLLTADLTKRYGCLKAAAEDIKKHKWFNSLDFTALFNRGLSPPIVPRVKSETDTSNFDPYPDSVEEAPDPVFSGKDPFEEF